MGGHRSMSPWISLICLGTSLMWWGATVSIIKTGFSTPAINMGQRLLQLQSTCTGFSNNPALLHVAQLSPNPDDMIP
ncbi:hypothetical protein K443DRAFT_290982 [Laccaria amethystina LaAM-08-1]|uniref:Uncharacterized protein n=1 Tax=Laccaria amethystina LaAM-08-1 TaxID=1095629 RepID=A0A0C9WNV9_9AGAR|nr:hypothetical protein K443DRAFT_439109 [Laccaria amethystina LaAM-08-1]KIJ96314.1 hypothetical protein K443DRAFT_290982 [Laccaria amethystina LaAM-08-1]